MVDRRILLRLPTGNVVLRLGSETFILFVSSLIWPMIDSYYATVLYTLSLAIGKEGGSASVESSHIIKRVQWLSEALYEERVLKLFEACNIESIKNAVATLKDMGILRQKSVFLMLDDRFRNDEQLLTALLDQIQTYRCQSNLGESLTGLGPNGTPHSSVSLRRSLMVEFPFMAKL